MGFLDSLLGMIGIGQPDVTLQLDTNPLKFGQLATGRVLVSGGKREMPLTAVDVRLVQREEQEDDLDSRTTVTEASIPMGGLTLTSGGSVETDFAFQVPADIEPTGGKVTYEIEASADVPGWDPSQDLEVHISPERDPMADEDYTQYHVLDEEREFRHSSVRGDFRIFSLPGGFGEGWKDTFIARGADGGKLWSLDGFGRTAAISPDGSKLAVADGNQRIALVDPESGEFVVEPISLGSYIDNFAWLENGDLVAAAHDTLYVLDAEGQQKASYNALDDGRDDPEDIFISGVAAASGSTFFVIDSNASTVSRVDAADGSAQHAANVRYPSDIYRSVDGSRYVIDSDDRVSIYDDNLGALVDFEVPGKRGVRFIGQTEHSYNAWKPMARLSPDNERMLLNDRSGQLWLMDATDGSPLRRYSREILDYVEDTHWIDDETFAAITNDGKLHIVEVDGFMPVFSEQDV